MAALLRHLARLDIPGVVLVTAAAGGILWGMVRGGEAGWGTGEVIAAFALGAAALAAFATRSGAAGGVAETERLFALYAAVGPAMWHELERQRSTETRSAFAAFTR